ncbi:hypothetical protein ASPZODRAFT_50108, partial [Penicilliopsis zonata CBS 506.65]
DVVSQSTILRAELKEWERAFAAANGGKKAGRDDIKKVPEIAAKYKTYAKLKSLESKGKDIELEERPKKRKHSSPTGPEQAEIASTPRKTVKGGGSFTTPSVDRVAKAHPSRLDPYDSPSTLRRLFSPSTHRQEEPSPQPLKTAIGPTPQRDGKALGLFDLLSESGGSTATPSSKRTAAARGRGGGAMQTPSKRRRSTMDPIAEEAEDDDSPVTERTPASSSKKWYLANLFATPTTLRYAAMVEVEDNAATAAQHPGREAEPHAPAAEPSETDTPFFLRRSNSGRYAGMYSAANDGSGMSPIAVRKPPVFVGKGLSALVQGLRDMEEERLDEDWEILKEIEAENAAANEAQVADSQAGVANGPTRVWKKRGQKRTTRRVKMKPVITKPTKLQPGWKDPDDGTPEESSEEEEPPTVPDTQAEQPDEEDDASLHTVSEPELDSDSDDDYTGENKPLARSKSFAEKMSEAISSAVKTTATKGSGLFAKTAKSAAKKEKEKEIESEKKPRPRKVNPEAHANYRSLKIRSRGSKGRGAGRFGRR